MLYRKMRHGRGNFAVKLAIMTYQEYFHKADFEDIWTILSGFYGEADGLKPEYETLVDKIKELPVLPEYSTAPIKMQLDSNNEIMVVGAPDPQEWLLGREVETDFSHWRDDKESKKCEIPNVPFDMLTYRQKRQLARQGDIATLAAHLLYWSTLYDIKTSQQHTNEFVKWLEELEDGIPHKQMIEQEYEADSRHRKHQKYWCNAVSGDSAIDWSANLYILGHKLEYNIGYWRYVQRHVGWEEDVKRMQLACSLINIVVDDYVDMNGVYVNAANARRFYKDNFDMDDTASRKYYLRKIRQAKAYDILWRFLNMNMKKMVGLNNLRPMGKKGVISAQAEKKPQTIK